LNPVKIVVDVARPVRETFDIQGACGFEEGLGWSAINSTVSLTTVSGGNETGPIGRNTCPSNLASIVLDIHASDFESDRDRRGSCLATVSPRTSPVLVVAVRELANR